MGPMLFLLSSSLLGGAVYDVTRSETFESLEHIWLNEWEMYSTVEAAVKMVVGNKVDLVRS